jgi:hypothetical protein
MEIAPGSLHERTPLVVGSRLDVDEAVSFIQGKHQGLTTERRSSAVRTSLT